MLGKLPETDELVGPAETAEAAETAEFAAGTVGSALLTQMAVTAS